MTTNNNPNILCFPRKILPETREWSDWQEAQELRREIQRNTVFLPRSRAEISRIWRQAISCAIIKKRGARRYMMFETSRTDTYDGYGPARLIIGGHVDHNDHGASLTIRLEVSLKRETEEELGILSPYPLTPIAVVTDHSSLRNSRHVAFLHEMELDEETSPISPEFV